MSLNATARARPALRRIAVGWLVLPCTLMLVLALTMPLFFASPSHLTSDESLYFAEAYNIAHGHGLTYPSGEAITHRAPLHPLLLAPAVRIGDIGGAHAFAKAVVVLDALLVLAIAWRIGGALAGGVAGVTAAASAYLNGLGTTLYLDPLQCVFLLLALLSLHEATRDPRQRWWIAAGVALGVAFLIKESAVQWAPLGVVAWLAVPSLRSRDGARGAFAFSAVFVATIAPWWAWVYVHDGSLFMLGEATPMHAGMLVAGLAVLLAFGAAAWRQPAVTPPSRIAMPLALMLVAGWGAFMLYGLTVYATWPYPNDFASTLPRYLHTVVPIVQPYFLLAAAWGWALARGRRDDGVRLMLLAAALFLPFALFSANRNLQLRDLLPLVYLSYALLGIAAADMLRSVGRVIDDAGGEALMYGVLALALGAFVFQQAQTFHDDNAAEAANSAGWDSPFVERSATWIETNLPPGSRLITSRLYFSSLYTETGARFEIRQLPTVRVDIDPRRDPMLDPRSNLFRWGDGALRPAQPGDTWLSLEQFPGKDYWVGLRQQELLEFIDAHDSDYLVLTGDDAAFSSLAYASVLTAHPAFQLTHWDRASAGDQLFVYAIDRGQLSAAPAPMAISPRDLQALSLQTGLDRAAIEAALGTPVRVTDRDWGLSDREIFAAVAVDGAP